MKSLVFFLVCILIISCSTNIFIKPPTEEKYFIPEHLNRFVIIHNRGDGEDVSKGKIKIYNIPNDGVLKVKSFRDKEWHNKEFYLITLSTDTIPLICDIDQTKKQHQILKSTPDSIIVYGMQWSDTDSSSNTCNYSSFCIGKVKNMDKSTTDAWSQFNLSKHCK